MGDKENNEYLRRALPCVCAEAEGYGGNEQVQTLSDLDGTVMFCAPQRHI